MANEQERREAAVAEALGRGRKRAEVPVEQELQPEAVVPTPRRPFERKPFGSFDQKLQYPPRPGYRRYWFNDEPGRIMRAREAGYDHVEDEAGRPVQTVVGIGRGGTALVAFLMEIPQEYFAEDMRSQETVVQELLGQIAEGNHLRPQGQDGDLRYSGSPKGNIRIESGTHSARR